MNKKKIIIIIILICLMFIFILVIKLSCTFQYVTKIKQVTDIINSYSNNPHLIYYKDDYIFYDSKIITIKPQNIGAKVRILHITDDYIIYYENSINHYDVYKLSNQGLEKIFDFDASFAFSSMYYCKNYVVYGYDLPDRQKYSFNLQTNEKKEISYDEYSDIKDSKYIIRPYGGNLEIRKGNISKSINRQTFKDDKLFMEICDSLGDKVDYKIEITIYDNRLIYVIMSIGLKYIIYNYDFVSHEIYFVV